MTRPLFVLCLSGLVAAGCSTETAPSMAPSDAPDVDPGAALAASWPDPISVYDFSGMEERMGLAGEDGGVASFRRRSQPCEAEPHRQLDFWIGQWDVNDVNAGPTGQSEIGVGLDGCVITEDFIGFGIRGRSLSAYDRATGDWIQTYVSELSTNFRLTGGMEGDELVMTGDRLFVLPSGNLFPVVDRIAWSPLPTEEARQVIQLSTDGGATFPFTLSDLVYSALDPFTPDEPIGSDSCTDEAFAALDYWEGDWTVKLGPWPIGTSTVIVDMSGCLVEEKFRSWRGQETRSFFSYDNTTESWHRTYVDDRGNAFRLEGDAVDGVVSLGGTRPFGSGEIELLNTIEPRGNGVVQEWAVTLPGSNHTGSVRLRYVPR